MKANDALEILLKAFSEYSFHYQFIKELGELLKRERSYFYVPFMSALDIIKQVTKTFFQF